MSHVLKITRDDIIALVTITGGHISEGPNGGNYGVDEVSEDCNLFGNSLSLCLYDYDADYSGFHRYLAKQIIDVVSQLDLPVKTIEMASGSKNYKPNKGECNNIIGYKGRHCLSTPSWLVADSINLFEKSFSRGKVDDDGIKLLLNEAFNDPNWHIVEVPYIGDQRLLMLEATLHHLGTDRMLAAGVEEISATWGSWFPEVTISDDLYALYELYR